MAHVVFVQGIGSYPRPDVMVSEWTTALANGMRQAGHTDVAMAFTHTSQLTTALAYYADLFRPRTVRGPQSQLTTTMNWN